VFQVENMILRQTENPSVKLLSANPILMTSFESYLEMRGLGLNEKTFIVCPLQRIAMIKCMMTVKKTAFNILLSKIYDAISNNHKP
jgi:hypothetical protein